MEYQLLRIKSNGKPALLEQVNDGIWLNVVIPDKWFDHPRPALPKYVSDVQGVRRKVHISDIHFVETFIAGDECFVPGAARNQSRIGVVKQWHHDNIYTVELNGEELICNAFWGELQHIMPESTCV